MWTKKEYEIFEEILLHPVYYYDGMLITERNVNGEAFFDKAEAEHLNNHIHLDSYMKCELFDKTNFLEIAKMLFYRLKCCFPSVPFIVYLAFDLDGNPILDFGACREGEQIFYDISANYLEYFVSHSNMYIDENHRVRFKEVEALGEYVPMKDPFADE